MAKEIDYKKFRWFFTSSGLLVVGGKSAEQNEQLIKLTKPNDVVLHTKDPGSPFCVIIDEIEETPADVQEAAIFCASLSQAWKKKKNLIEVNIFRREQMNKTKSMKKGTFGVKGGEQKIKVVPKLYLTFQENKLRCVPFECDIAEITPGDLSKVKAAEAIAKRMRIPLDEVLSTLPPDKIGLKWL
ncbi:NFACT RNA binding domain-containing protein [Nanoarchaeota archaeon]